MAFQIIVAVISVASALLASGPTTQPANVNRTSSSPNNSLGARENQVRLLQRIEDIYGTVRAIPSLLMPTYFKYIGHRKVEYGYYCVGRGYHALADVRDADTQLTDIPNASAAFYGPFTSPNSGDAPFLLIGDPIIDKILTVARSEEVDGITLKAANQINTPASAEYTLAPSAGGDLITQVTKRPNFNSIAVTGDLVTIDIPGATRTLVPAAGQSLSATAAGSTSTFLGAGGFEFAGIEAGDTITVAGFLAAENNGTFVVLSKPTEAEVIVDAVLTPETSETATVTIEGSFSEVREVAAVGDGDLLLVGSEWTQTLTGTGLVQLEDREDFSAWITLLARDRTEVFVNVVAGGGMYRDDGGRSETMVDFVIEIERLNPGTLAPTGTVETVIGSISGAVQDERAETIEHTTSWVGPARVRMRRTSQFDYEFKGTIVDEIKWADLYAVSPVDREQFGNLTTVHTITRATSRATAVKTRQLNCLASRLIPTFDGTGFSAALNPDGSLASGTLHPSSKIVDIIAAVALDPVIGARDLAELDMAQMFTVQQQLDAWHPEAGIFNYTFDGDSMSFEETVQAVANAAFCNAYRQSGRIRLALDRPQANSVALFTHRNKKPNAETVTRTFASDGDYDGVEFVYQDPDTGSSETIRLPADGSALRPKKFELPGIRSFPQAWFRANREYARLLYQRLAIETTCTTDARSLLPNSRVDIVDNTRSKSFDGEVIAQDGLVLRLAQRVEFTPGEPHSIVLMRRDGSIQGIACTPGVDRYHVVLQNLPSEAIVTEGGAAGVRTIYSFAADSVRWRQAWLVQEIQPPEDNYVTVRAVNYSPEVYAHDGQPVPEKYSVIN